jgi:hypothetical protein
MEVFLEPAVIVGLIAVLLSKRLADLGEFLLGHMSLVPSKALGRVRVLRWRYRKNLILSARNQHKVTWAIVRTYSLLIFFVLVIVLYLLLITIGPLKGIGDLPQAVQAFIAAPIYITEVLWLLQKEKAQDIITASEKLVTSQSTSRLLRRLTNSRSGQ